MEVQGQGGSARPRGSSTFVPVADVRVSSYTVPTEAPESDGTLVWSATTLVVVAVVVAAGEMRRTALRRHVWLPAKPVL